VSLSTLDNPAADVLRVLAVSRSTGALEIRGAPAGTIFLLDGDVTFAEAPGSPAVPEPGSLAGQAFDAAVRDAVVESGLILLTAPARERPLFRPGRQYWTGHSFRLGVDAVLSEVERRAARLADLGVEPDAGIRLRGLRRGRPVVLTAEQWGLVAALDDVETTRSLAWRSGTSLTAAVRAVASLLRAGVCQAVSPPPPPVPAAPPPVPAPPPVAPAPAAVVTPLPRRPRGRTQLPPGPHRPGGPSRSVAPSGSVGLAGPRAAVPTGWADFRDEGRVVLAERLLAGLRRL
jgi:hypothetical protein